jgi:hypothetical protein
MVANGVTTLRQPAGAEPASDCIARDPQPASQAPRAVLVAAQS